jgi:hypothetical protein
MDAQQNSEQKTATPPHLEAEIKALEAALAAKKAAFESGKTGDEKFSHKEALHDIVKERYIETGPRPQEFLNPKQPAPAAATPAQPAPVLPTPQHVARKHTTAPLETRQTVQQLVNTVFEEGIFPAVDKAKMYGPYVLDEFHHALVDQLHDEMARRGIIEEV